ncbi:MAG: sulfatase-like hydrolase/transferase, partial [Pseudomonadota bacterium]
MAAGRDPVDALPSGVRNVLWIVMDTTRRDRMTVYDPELDTTPNLARLAAQGAVFEGASSSSTFTLSSHASMLTGLSPSGHNATLRTQWLSPRVPMLQVELGQAGLATAAFVANRVLRLEVGLEAGF